MTGRPLIVALVLWGASGPAALALAGWLTWRDQTNARRIEAALDALVGDMAPDVLAEAERITRGR